jgi:uncharacterized protein YjeT (DUF2065 family)
MEPRPGGRTRLSLYYLAGYLIPAGVMFFFAPQLTLKLLFSNGHYEDACVRFCGVLILGLGIVVVQLIRHRVDVLYPTTLLIRAVLSVGLVTLYFRTGDPCFLSILGVVLVGVMLTGTAWLAERRRSRS